MRVNGQLCNLQGLVEENVLFTRPLLCAAHVCHSLVVAFGWGEGRGGGD